MTPETRASAPAPESPAPSRARATTWQSVPLAGVITIYGLTMAGLTPTLSLFLANAVHAVPFLIGLFFTVFALAGIAVGLVTGWLSDRMRDRRALMFAAGLSGAISALCLALLRDYALILVACAVFGGLGQSFFGQVFAYTNEFAHAHERDVTAYSAAMRSVFSAGYVIGPPLALSVMARYGFRPLYLSVAVCTLAAAVIGRWGLRQVPPRVPPRVRSRTAGGGAWRVLRGGLSLSARTWFLLGVVLLFSMVIQMYNIDISLHVTKDLGRSPALVGLMMGLTAALEIPVMIVAGRVATRFGRGRLTGLAAVAAAVSYCLMPFAASPAALLAVAALVGVWQAVALSIPMVMVQDESPGGVGTASSLYGTAFGAAGLIAGAAVGVTASALGYRDVLWVCAGLSALAAAGMLARTVAGPPPDNGRRLTAFARRRRSS